MLFNSLGFLLFFPTVTIVYFLIPQKIKYLWLLLASYYFYMCWNPQYALLILTSTAVTFLSGILIDRAKTAKARKWAVAASFIINLLILFYFKYFYFTVDNINAVLKALNLPKIVPRFDVILPVGISFYTFQALSYTVDVYRKEVEPEKNFLKYALFVSFFPQLVAGPIERSKNLLSQVNGEHHFDYYRVRKGLLTMLWGFFLKLVIADRAAILVNTVYDNMEAFGGAYIALATVCFALQIYCDFASYSIIAIGAAEVMDFKLMKNFERPYFAVSIGDFWRRWHISLSTWFRDYLYIPLGGNKKGTARKYLNVMIVFLVSGLWHGASWHFVIWGAIHGFYQIFGGITEPLRKKARLGLHIENNPIYLCIRRALVFLLVCFAWIFFRSASLSEAGFAINRIFTGFKLAKTAELGLDKANLIALAVSAFVLFGVSALRETDKISLEKTEKMNIFARWLIYYALIFAVLIFGIYGPGYAESQFIYFQF